MLIKAIQEIKSEKGIIETNKLRMKMIKDNIGELSLVDALFGELEKSIKEKDFNKINDIVSKKLFFEIPCCNFEEKLIDAYERNDKEYFINNLKKSYLLRGVKGLNFAWMPIILK